MGENSNVLMLVVPQLMKLKNKLRKISLKNIIGVGLVDLKKPYVSINPSVTTNLNLLKL